MRYGVSYTVDATAVVFVEADSIEDAKAKGEQIMRAPTLCHHCSRVIQIGDPLEVIDAWEDE